MSILMPIWLLLLIPAAVLLYMFRPPTKLLLLLRGITFVLIILAVSRVVLKLPRRSGTVVVVADRSVSMGIDALNNQAEIINIITDAMRAEDKFGVVSFGRDAVIEHPPQPGTFAGFVADVGDDQSNLGAAIEKAVSIIPSDEPGRILVLSDGCWTGINPDDAAGRAASRNIGVDFRLQAKSVINDLAIDRIVTPDRLSSGESFMLTAWVQSPISQDVSYKLVRGNTVLAAGKRKMNTGVNRLVFRDKAGDAGTQQYILNVRGEQDDAQPENNNAVVLVGIDGNRQLLCVSETALHSFSSVLAAGKIRLKTVLPGDARWTLAELSNYSGVIFENIAAGSIGVSGMEMLAAWVEDSGAGFMMTGGKNSFAPGGYFKSPLERILPVSMELKKEHRKFDLAIVIVLDRSGSMAASAGMGRTKMDLANIGTVQVLDLLSDEDEIGVIAVDSMAHIVVPIASVERNKGARNLILEIESMGGGIYIYEALQAATRMLLKSNSDTRHIILFADAADSEEPGKYKELLAKCKSANITCSVIGLGTTSDCDAQLLKDVAKVGSGQCFFSKDAAEIPRLFAQDTFTVSRSALIDDPTGIRFMAGYSLLAGITPKTALMIGGYNLCYIRPEANLAVITTDEYKAPVVAAWQAGRGRVLCYTGEVDGKYTGAMAKWNGVGSFYSSMVRWVAGDKGPLPPDMMLEQTLNEGVCRIELNLDPERKNTSFNGVPYISMLHGIRGANPKRERLNMKWVDADKLAVEFSLYGDETALPTVHIDGQSPVTLRPVCLPYSPEFRPVQADRGFNALQKLANTSGGRECGNVGTIWNDLPKQIGFLDISSWLYMLAILFLLIDVLQRRTGILSWIKVPASYQIKIDFRKEPHADKVSSSGRDKKKVLAKKEEERPVTVEVKEDDTISALHRARRRGKHRTKR